MGKSEKRIKSDRINVLRKQYDAFLEDDKKRRQRNEYILGSFDKISSGKTVIQIRHRHADFGRISAISRNGLFSEMQPTYDVKMSLHQPTQLNISPNHTEESMLINELSKKFILIPKLNPNTTLVEQTFIKPSIDQSDWTSKYKILDTLKHEQNKPYESPENEVSSLKKEDGMFLSDQKRILWQNQDAPTKENTDIASLSIPKTIKEYKDNQVLHTLGDTRKLNLTTNNIDVEPTNLEILSHNLNEENFSILNNNKKLSLKRDGDVPTTSNSCDYEYKSEKDKDKPTKSEEEYRYGPFGPQTEPFTYEYKYQKDTDGIDYNPTSQQIVSIETPCNSTEKSFNQTVLITENVGDNLKEDEALQENILENKEENNKTEQNKDNTDNLQPKNASQTSNLESERDNPNLSKPTNLINQNWNQPCIDVNYTHDQIKDKQSLQQDEPNEQQQKQQIIETTNPTTYDDNINDSPLTQYEPSLVYDPTETIYEQEALSSEMQQLNEQNHINSQQHYNSNVPAFDSTQQNDQADAVYTQDLNNLHEDQYNLVQQQQLNTNQQELDPNQQQQLKQQEHDSRQHYNDIQQDYEPNPHQQLSQDHQEYDSQQQYNNNQQYYEPDQHQQLEQNLQEYDSDQLKQYNENQLEYSTDQMYNAIQQEYDPNQQQEFSQNQQGYDPQQEHIEEGYDANEAEYEKTQVEYESNQNQYDPNQVTYEPIQQHYDDNTTDFDVPEQEYDPNQQAFDTNPEGFEVFPQHAVSDSQYSEPVHQEHEQEILDSEKQLSQANYEEMRDPEMNQQISIDGKNKLITRESLQPSQLPNQDVKTPALKAAKEKKEVDSKNLAANKKTKGQSIEQTKVGRKLKT